MGIQPYITPSVGAGVVGGEASGSLLLVALPAFSKPTLDVQPSTFTFKLEPPKIETSTPIMPSTLPDFTTTILGPPEKKTDFAELALPSMSGIVEPLTRQTLTLELAQKPSAKLLQTPDVFGDLAQPQLSKQGLFQAPTLETKTKPQMITPPIFQGITDLIYTQNLDIPTLTTPRTTPKVVPIPTFDIPNAPPPTPTLTIPTPSYTPTVPKLFDLPKLSAGGLGPREQSGMFYPFGRQKRKYPVMTGQQVAKFLFSGKTETKRRKKK